MTDTEKRNHRNVHGVKESYDQYRTIKGAHYVAWSVNPSADRIAAYRTARVRCALRGDDLYVHHMDTDNAARIDAGENDDGGWDHRYEGIHTNRKQA